LPACASYLLVEERNGLARESHGTPARLLAGVINLKSLKPYDAACWAAT